MEALSSTSETSVSGKKHSIDKDPTEAECLILVVDDNVTFASVLRYAIEGSMPNALVTAVTNPIKGLEFLRDHEFAVILCDYRMPEMDGVEFIRRAAESAPQTPVVLMSGVDDPKLAIKARSGGAFDLLLKPVDRNSVVSILERAIEAYNGRIGKRP